jgi:tetratricopeptide (TPR) repeat protein
MCLPGDPPRQVADRVRATDVSAALVAALDDWAICAQNSDRQEWALEVARKADPGSAWHDRVRDLALRGDAAALLDLARDAPLDGRSVSLLLVLGRLLEVQGADAVGFLRGVQRAHPGDFWVNFTLAEALGDRRDPDSIGFFRAALAARPSALSVYVNLGKALSEQGRVDEAMEYWRYVARLVPDATFAHYNLAINHLRRREFAQAVLHGRQAVAIDSEYGAAHAALAEGLFHQGQFAEGAAECDRALALLPKDSPNRGRATFTQARSRRMLALAPRVAAVVQGTDRPADAREAIGFAEYFALTKQFVAAARMYTDAFVRDPALADSPDWSYRYDAACAAVRAASSAGDAAQIDGPDRASLRARAFAWLRAECDARAVRYRQSSPAGQLAAARELRQWLVDDNLAGVRDETLMALPEDEQRSWQKLWRDFADIAARDPTITVEFARAQAARRHWSAAAASYAQAFGMQPTDEGGPWFEFAAVKLLSGDRDGYGRTCAEMIKRSKLPEMRSYHVARACTLAPDAVPDLARVKQLSDRELQLSAGAFWSLTERGALRCRAGRYQEALPLLEQSLRAEPVPGAALLNWLWLSLACGKLDRLDEARRWLNQAGNWLDHQGTELPADARAVGLDLHNWLEAHVLRREAAAILHAGRHPG